MWTSAAVPANPDVTAQTAWAQARSELAGAARDCIIAVDRGDAALSSEADNKMFRGSITLGLWLSG
jgi:hypothetical protein